MHPTTAGNSGIHPMKSIPMTRFDISARLRAMGIHFLITLLVAAVAAALVFGLWFPPPFARMLGGLELFLLVVVCDLVLGPLISLVIYNRKKPNSELLRDYLIVGLIQLAALLYGMHAVASTRPVFLVFAIDRLEVVSAGELDADDLRKGTEAKWQQPAWTGPVLARAERPSDSQERSDLLFSALAGKDIQHFPRYYREYGAAKADILARAGALPELQQQHPQARAELDAAVARSGLAESQLRWLPARHAKGFWTVLIDADSALPVAWLELDPY